MFDIDTAHGEHGLVVFAARGCAGALRVDYGDGTAVDDAEHTFTHQYEQPGSYEVVVRDSLARRTVLTIRVGAEPSERRPRTTKAARS